MQRRIRRTQRRDQNPSTLRAREIYLRQFATLLDLVALLEGVDRKANCEEWSVLASAIIEARWEVSKARNNLLRKLGYNARTWRVVTDQAHELFGYDPCRIHNLLQAPKAGTDQEAPTDHELST